MKNPTSTQTTIPHLKRRDFLSALGLTSVTLGCPAAAAALKAEDPDKGLQTFQATCSMECLHCNLKAFVKDGKIVKISSANPFDGKACGRGLSRIKWVYAEDRVLYPMKRVGQRGEGKFERITWDEALDTVAEKIKEAMKKAAASLFFSHPLREIWIIWPTVLKLPLVIISAVRREWWVLSVAQPLRQPWNRWLECALLIPATPLISRNTLFAGAIIRW